MKDLPTKFTETAKYFLNLLRGMVCVRFALTKNQHGEFAMLVVRTRQARSGSHRSVVKPPFFGTEQTVAMDCTLMNGFSLAERC